MLSFLSSLSAIAEIISTLLPTKTKQNKEKVFMFNTKKKKNM